MDRESFQRVPTKNNLLRERKRVLRYNGSNLRLGKKQGGYQDEKPGVVGFNYSFRFSLRNS